MAKDKRGKRKKYLAKGCKDRYNGQTSEDFIKKFSVAVYRTVFLPMFSEEAVKGIRNNVPAMMTGVNTPSKHYHIEDVADYIGENYNNNLDISFINHLTRIEVEYIEL